MLVTFRDYVRNKFYVAETDSASEDFWFWLWGVLDWMIELGK